MIANGSDDRHEIALIIIGTIYALVQSVTLLIFGRRNYRFGVFVREFRIDYRVLFVAVVATVGLKALFGAGRVARFDKFPIVTDSRRYNFIGIFAVFAGVTGVAVCCAGHR